MLSLENLSHITETHLYTTELGNFSFLSLVYISDSEPSMLLFKPFKDYFHP